jgi:glycosyltransferase involved in cell wall biosynthesis
LRAQGVAVGLSVSRQAEIYEKYREQDVPIYPIDTYCNAAMALGSVLRLPLVRRRLRRAIDDFGADVVLATMSHLWNCLCVDIVEAAGVKLVTVVHDATMHPGDGLRPRHAMVDRELRRSVRIVALTKHVANQIVSVYGQSEGRIEVIPHGVCERARPAPTSPQIPSRPFRFLFFGRFLLYKGFDLLSEAVDALTLTKTTFELKIVGSGSRGILGKLASHPCVNVINRWVPDDEISVIMSEVDAVVLPYIEASQSGVAAAAIGMGIPVITTPVGGLPEQIQPYEAGLVASDVTGSAFAECMVRIANDRQLHARLSANAARAAAGPLSWPAIARRFIDLFESISADDGTRPVHRAHRVIGNAAVGS